jgi:hypothetical protein
MESKELTKAIRDAFVACGFARHASHFYCSSPELVWAVALQKSRHGQRWYVNIGILARPLHPGVERPREDDCDIQTRYEDLPGPVPPAAHGSRLSDRRSYFTMILDLGHQMVDDAERRAAIDFMADDLAATADSVTTVEDLAQRYADGGFNSAYVARSLRAMLESIS